MLHFDSDYMEGAHPAIMERLLQTNLEQTPGYETDIYSNSVREMVRTAVGNHFADVHLLVGGTQANATVINALLRGAEAVIAADTGHINVHEAGAIEATGHKVITLPGKLGKLDAGDLESCLHDFYEDDTWMHMSLPAMVYISFPTEYGTLYTLKELEAISDVCHRYSIKLYMDGARMGYGLAAKGCDITIKDIYRLCDAFYIGGTKVGALFGEAVVLKNKDLAPHFYTDIKRSGAMLAKGRLLGLQFETLFVDNFKLYMECGRNAVDRAMELRAAFESKGYEPAIDSPTNQQFFALPNAVIDQLAESATFEYWGPRGAESSTVRFVTSWATKPEDIAALAAVIPKE
ncbi:MAG: low specificity L-threonine aldolase [Bacteroidaceae bacterium]|nr:low specificity L-threonine aldolase [Bacteroidaceae bacterium]